MSISFANTVCVQDSLGAIVRDDFPSRLRECIGDERVAAFARRCGFSEGLIRSYLKNIKRPGFENLIRIANVAGVTLDWLATGRGPRRRVDTAEAYGLGSAPHKDKWQELIDLVESLPDEQAGALIDEFSARAQEKAETFRLKQTIAELRAALRRD